MTIRDLVSISLMGGGMVIDASQCSVDALKEIANVSAENSIIVIKNALQIDASDLQNIACLADGSVIFDFTE